MTRIDEAARELAVETVFAPDHIRRWLDTHVQPGGMTIEQASSLVRKFSPLGIGLPSLPVAGQGKAGNHIETDWREFVCANMESHVVEAVARGNGGEGAYYTLANGRVFRLSAEDCRLIGVPDWGFDLGDD